MPRGRIRSWTDEELRRAVAGAASLTDAIRALGLRPAGGNHQSVRRHVARLGLDTAHFAADRRMRGLREYRARTAATPDEVFRTGSRASGPVLRRLARRHVVPHWCADCGNAGWHNGRPLTLHLDHVNGVHDDNRLENLRWLCPNCHSQTPTYCGRSSRRRPSRISEASRAWPGRRARPGSGSRTARCAAPSVG